MKTTLLVLSSCVLLTACKKEGAATTTSPVPGNKDFSPLTQIVQSNLQQLGGNAGLLLMSKDGSVLYKQYFGLYDDSTFIPVASGSKWPSMACILSLVDEGLLTLDDKISKYYPAEYAAADRKDITLRQLMSHTSGLAGGSAWISSDSINLQQATKGIGAGGMIGSTYTVGVSTPHAPAGSKLVMAV